MKRKLSSGFDYGIDSKGNRICRGARMGRGNRLADYSGKLHLIKVRMSDCYDYAGAYWGYGDPLYWAYSDVESEGEPLVEVFTRATNREEAKANVSAIQTGAAFFR